MEDIDQSNAEIGLQQKNTLLQAWSDFKDSIFNVLFVILDKKSEEEEDESLWGLIFETGLDYLQIMAFPFNIIVIQAWNGGATLNNISSFFNTFNLSKYLPNAPFAAYLVMLYALIFIILLIIADIIYVSYSFSKKKFKFTFPLVILANIVPLFVTVLFLPITQTMLSVVQCQFNNGAWTMSSFPTVVCWQGWHLFHALIALLFITLFVVISTVVALALFEPRMTSKKLTARQNSNGQVVFIINKIVLQFFFSFNPFPGSTFYVIILFLLSFWQFWCYTIKQPYQSKTATKFFKICSTYYFWTALMLLIGQLLSTYNFTGSLVIWICGLPFFGIIIYFEGASDTSTLYANNMKFKTGDQLDNHITCVLQLVSQQQGDKSSYMLLIGYIQKHKQICNESDCPLKVQTKKTKTASIQNMDYNCQQVLKQVDRMFKAGIKKFSDSTKLRMSFALFQLEQLHNKEKAFEQFVAASKLEPNFQQQFNIYRFKKIIRQNLEDREQSETDLVETIRFDNHVSLLEEAMLLSAKLHKQFWTQLKQEKPDLKKLNTVGSQITEAGNTILQNYKELSKINSSACQVLYIYAQYQILVNENFSEGKELLANARKIYQDKQTGDKNEPQIQFQTDSFNKLTSPLLVLTYNEADKAFKITNANLMITEITGYQREQLFNKDLSVISTNIFQSMKLSCFTISASQQSQKSGFIKHKFNHLIAVKYTVKRKNDGQWQVTLKLDSQNNLKMIILANKNGEIKDYNLLAMNLLRDLQEQCSMNNKTLHLADLGLNNWEADKYRSQIGSSIYVKIGNREGECNMQVEALKAHENLDPNEQEDEQALAKREKEIGWKLNLSKLQNTYLVEQIDNQQCDLIQRNNSQLDEGVLQLYQNPTGINFFLSKVQESKMIQENCYQRENRFVLKQKISLMRLMDNQIKMVYANGNDNDYNDSSANISGEDDREVFKFDDQSYQAKLRTAINTNLSHGEVSSLRKMSVIFILLLFSLIIVQLTLQSQQIAVVQNFIKQISLRANQYSWLTTNVMTSINSSANYNQSYQKNLDHTVEFSTDVSVNLILQNGVTTTKNLKDAVIFLNSRFISFIQSPNTDIKSISSVFINYINSIYPAFLNYPITLDINTSLSFIMGGVALALTISMMLYWIYISLKIDKKRYDIMIWFLDIPIPYVTHLGNHCDKYLKQFIGVKELAQKGIPMDQDQDTYQEYSNKKNSLAADEEQIQQQIKARKSLISKNKKETLISKINVSALKVLWLLAYSLFFSSLLLGMSQRFYQDFQFLQAQWIQSYQTIVIDNTLYIALQMQSKNMSLPINLTTLLDTLKMSHKGVIIQGNLQSFNQAILNFHLTDISTIYNTVYFGNLCTVLPLTTTQLAQCTSLVGNKLQSGYQVYSKYLITPETSMNNQIAVANGGYVIPALETMLQTWQDTLTSQGNQLVNLCTIMLYIFIIFSIFAFLMLWLYYLRKLNTELNQTIQMLNMIPFKLLPKSRKETKMFIAWIIREANKTNHQEQ